MMLWEVDGETFLEIEPQMLERNFRVNVMGLLYLAREVAPEMIKSGNGAILVTGNTSAIRVQGEFCRLRPDQGGSAYSVGIDRARSRAARYPCRLCPDRRRDRLFPGCASVCARRRMNSSSSRPDRGRAVACL